MGKFVPLEEHLVQVNEIDLLRQIAYTAWKCRTMKIENMLLSPEYHELNFLLSDYRQEFGFRKMIEQEKSFNRKIGNKDG